MNLWHDLGQFINLNHLVFTFSKSRMRTQEHGVKSLFKVNYKKTKAKFYSLKTSGFLMFSRGIVTWLRWFYCKRWTGFTRYFFDVCAVDFEQATANWGIHTYLQENLTVSFFYDNLHLYLQYNQVLHNTSCKNYTSHLLSKIWNQQK